MDSASVGVLVLEAGISRRFENRKGGFIAQRPHPVAPRAFEELVSEHLDSLYRTALRLVGGGVADAEDLLQDAVLRAFEHFSQLRNQDAGRSWLFAILVRTNLNRVRAAGRRSEQLTADVSDGAFEEALAAWQPSATPEELFESMESADRIVEALDDLNPELRAVIVLTAVEGFSQREAAQMLGVPEGTVASRLFRARRDLRDALSEGAKAVRARGRR